MFGMCVGAGSQGSATTGGNSLVIGTIAIFVVFCAYAVYELVAYIRAK